ncbi:TPM domain-containing protein [uncultured Sphingomonas sp.]|uniref:TPM domain-containing protein n=1 Tax=uncultured Sphingomonas sp. TaxID=158754 RepID=UPI0035CAC9CF
MAGWRLILALLLAVLAGAARAQTFPKFTGLVVDAANVLPPAVEADLTAKLGALQRDTKRQLVVATVANMQGYPIADYGYRLGRAWGVGLADVNNGAILLIAPNEPPGQRGPRIEVGYGLEPVLTDALSSVIINERMMPRLKGGDVPGAMTAGVDAIVAQLRASPDEAKARTDAAVAEFDRTHRRRTQQDGGGGVPGSLIFWGVIFAFVVLPMLRGRRGGGRRYRGGGGSGLPIALWALGSQMGRGGGGYGGGSSGDSGGWGGGGFSGGGGGSFGGGGASGSW